MSTATINTSTYPQFTDLIQRSFVTAPTSQLDNVMMNSGIVRKETISANSGGVRRFAQTVISSPYTKQGTEGGPAGQLKPQYGYEKDLIVDKHDGGISITYEERNLGKNPDIINQLVGLAPKAYAEIDLDLAHRLTFAWSTSYTNSAGISKDLTCGDGLALISTVHTLTGSPTTFSNQVANNPAFSKSSLISALNTAVENTYDNLGNKMAIEYDTLLVPDNHSTIVAAKELINATADITSANANTYNAFGGSYLKLVVCPRIATTTTGGVDTTKKTYWFLASSKAKPIIYGEAVAPQLSAPRDGNNGEDASTGNWNWYVRSIYGVAVPSPIGIIGSKGDGSV